MRGSKLIISAAAAIVATALTSSAGTPPSQPIKYVGHSITGARVQVFVPTPKNPPGGYEINGVQIREVGEDWVGTNWVGTSYTPDYSGGSNENAWVTISLPLRDDGMYNDISVAYRYQVPDSGPSSHSTSDYVRVVNPPLNNAYVHSQYIDPGTAQQPGYLMVEFAVKGTAYVELDGGPSQAPILYQWPMYGSGPGPFFPFNDPEVASYGFGGLYCELPVGSTGAELVTIKLDGGIARYPLGPIQ